MKQAWVVGDLLLGDGGKGVEVARLVKEFGATLVVRYNGGANAAHNVVDRDFRHHTFCQYGSGSFLGASTYLGRHVRFDPVQYMEERNRLRAKGVQTTLYVNPRCVVVTPLHIIHSQEIAAEHMRGSTGMGVGVAARYAALYPDDAILVRDMSHFCVLRDKLRLMRERFNIDLDIVRQVAEHLFDIRAEMRVAENTIFTDHERVVFEGAQGALLDAERGFKPYVTSSDTSFKQALEMIPNGVEVVKAGVCRIYMTRHGAGPFTTETSQLAIPESHNRDGEENLQGKWRQGWLDLAMAQKGLDILGGVDYIAMSHVDYWKSRKRWWIAEKREDPLDTPTQWSTTIWKDYAEKIQSELQTPIKVLGFGKRAEDREVL